MGVNIQHSAKLSFQHQQILEFVQQFLRASGSRLKELFVSFIRRIVPLDKVAYIDLFLPFSCLKSFPLCKHLILPPIF